MDENDKLKNATTPVATPDNSINQPSSKVSAHQYIARASNRKGLLILLICIAVLLGAFALAYVYWFQNPNKVVADGLSHAFNAKSLTYTGSVTTVGPTKMNVDLNGEMSPGGSTINADFAFDTNDKKYTFKGDGLVDAKSDLYLRVKSIDGLVANYRSSVPTDTQPLFDQIIAKIDNKWIKISADDIKEFNPQLAKAQECIASTYQKLQNDEAAKSELIATYKKHPFIVVDRVLGAKDGSLGYTLTTDKDSSKAFAKDYKTTSLYKSVQNCDEGFAIDENEVMNADDNNAQIEVWIDRWSHHITRIVTKEGKDGQTTNVSIEPAFNRPATVTTPKETTTIEQLQKDIMSLLQTAQQPSANSAPVPQSAPTSAS